MDATPARLLALLALALCVAACDEPQPEEPAEGQGGRKVVPRMETGFWQIARDPAGPSEEEALRDLDRLGYLQGYEAAGEEYGVTAHDPERAYQGLNLVVSAHRPEVLLEDMGGNPLHSWSFDFDQVLEAADWEPPSELGKRFFRRARLMDEGRLLALYERTGLVLLDRDSQLIWGLAGYYHHDFDVTADGTIWVLTHEVRVIPRIHETRDTFEDFVTRVSPDGQVLGRFSLLEAFERSYYAPLLQRLPQREDVFHTNTLEILEEGEHTAPFGPGKALVSIWGLDAVAVVDLETETVEWALTGQWHRQHEPVLTEGGNLLVFDNLGHGDFSKVVEVDPLTQRRVWAFLGDELNDFYSALCGSNQRLPNGNTLITESLSGRAFEVTREGDVVWRWASPYRVGPNAEGVAVLMEMIRLDPELDLSWLDR